MSSKPSSTTKRVSTSTSSSTSAKPKAESEVSKTSKTSKTSSTPRSSSNTSPSSSSVAPKSSIKSTGGGGSTSGVPVPQSKPTKESTRTSSTSTADTKKVSSSASKPKTASSGSSAIPSTVTSTTTQPAASKTSKSSTAVKRNGTSSPSKTSKVTAVNTATPQSSPAKIVKVATPSQTPVSSTSKSSTPSKPSTLGSSVTSKTTTPSKTPPSKPTADKTTKQDKKSTTSEKPKASVRTQSASNSTKSTTKSTSTTSATHGTKSPQATKPSTKPSTVDSKTKQAEKKSISSHSASSAERTVETYQMLPPATEIPVSSVELSPAIAIAEPEPPVQRNWEFDEYEDELQFDDEKTEDSKDRPSKDEHQFEESEPNDEAEEEDEEEEEDTIFKDAGKLPGIEIWIISKLDAEPLDPALYGKFYKERSYIVLHTAKHKSNVEYHIHYWVGKDAPLESAAVAGLLSIELRRRLDAPDKTHYFREDQGEEGDQFISHFYNYSIPFKVVKGKQGPVSGFKHVDKTYKKRLIRISGTNKQFQTKQVEPVLQSLTKEDSFVLDAGSVVFVWNGSLQTNRAVKAKALEVATKIKTEVGCTRAVQVVDDNDNDEFWATLNAKFSQNTEINSKAEKKPKGEEEGGEEDLDSEDEDEDEDQDWTSDWLYQVSEESGKMKLTPLEETEFERALLKPGCSYILDCETEVFLWHAKECTLDQKSAAYELAGEILSLFERPSWTKITRVMEGSEPTLFKEKFKDWTEAPLVPKPTVSQTLAIPQSKPIDVVALHMKKPPPETLLDLQEGIIEVWVSSPGAGVGVAADWEHLSREEHGLFCSSKSYICHFIYQEPNAIKLKSKVFFWEGVDSLNKYYISYHFGFAEELADMMREIGSDTPEEIRILQHKESQEFLNIFGNRMVIYKENYLNSKSMFHVRGFDNNTRATQVSEVSAASLCSSDSFVILDPHFSPNCYTIFVWHGQGCDQAEREWAETLAEGFKEQLAGSAWQLTHSEASPVVSKRIELEGKSRYRSASDTPPMQKHVKRSLSRSIVISIVEENNEPSSFWASIGGHKEYASADFLKQGSIQRYIATMIEEVFRITQGDLGDRDCIILDAFWEVWSGREALPTTIEFTIKIATEYIEKATDARPSNCQVVTVRTGEEPPLFTCNFHAWDFTKGRRIFQDPLAERSKVKRKKSLTKEETSKDEFLLYDISKRRTLWDSDSEGEDIEVPPRTALEITSWINTTPAPSPVPEHIEPTSPSKEADEQTDTATVSQGGTDTVEDIEKNVDQETSGNTEMAPEGNERDEIVVIDLEHTVELQPEENHAPVNSEELTPNEPVASGVLEDVSEDTEIVAAEQSDNDDEVQQSEEAREEPQHDEEYAESSSSQHQIEEPLAESSETPEEQATGEDEAHETVSEVQYQPTEEAVYEEASAISQAEEQHTEDQPAEDLSSSKVPEPQQTQLSDSESSDSDDATAMLDDSDDDQVYQKKPKNRLGKGSSSSPSSTKLPFPKLFKKKKEEPIQIGAPTDFKHVATGTFIANSSPIYSATQTNTIPINITELQQKGQFDPLSFVGTLQAAMHKERSQSPKTVEEVRHEINELSKAQETIQQKIEKHRLLMAKAGELLKKQKPGIFQKFSKKYNTVEDFYMKRNGVSLKDGVNQKMLEVLEDLQSEEQKVNKTLEERRKEMLFIYKVLKTQQTPKSSINNSSSATNQASKLKIKRRKKQN